MSCHKDVAQISGRTFGFHDLLYYAHLPFEHFECHGLLSRSYCVLAYLVEHYWVNGCQQYVVILHELYKHHKLSVMSNHTLTSSA